MRAAKIHVGECLTWLFHDPRRARRLAVASLWMLASLLLVPMVLLWGYGARVLRVTARERVPRVPGWERPLELFADGARVLLVLVSHHVPVLLLLWAAGWGMVRIGILSNDPQTGLQQLAIAGAVLTAWTIFMLWSFYVLAALTRAVVLDRLQAAFEPSANASFLSRNAENFALMWVVLLVTNLAFQLSPCLCCVGILPAAAWVHITLNHALGLIARFDGIGAAPGSAVDGG